MQRLFVYGSLKPGEPRYELLKEFADTRNIDLAPRPATTAGLLYALEPTYPAMLLLNSNVDALVDGWIFNIDGDPAIVGLLNSIEGYDFAAKLNVFEPVRIYAEEKFDKASVACWTYAIPSEAFNILNNNAREYPMCGPQKEKAMPLVLVENGIWSSDDQYFPEDVLKAYQDIKDEEEKLRKAAEVGGFNATN